MDLNHNGSYDIKDLNILLKDWENSKSNAVVFVAENWGKTFKLFSGRVLQSGGYIKNAIIKIKPLGSNVYLEDPNAPVGYKNELALTDKNGRYSLSKKLLSTLPDTFVVEAHPITIGTKYRGQITVTDGTVNSTTNENITTILSNTYDKNTLTKTSLNKRIDSDDKDYTENNLNDLTTLKESLVIEKVNKGDFSSFKDALKKIPDAICNMFSLKNQDGIIDATILELDPFKDSSDIITDVATKKEKVKSAALTSGMASYNTFKKQTMASIKNAVTTKPTKKNGSDNVTVTERDNAVNLITDEKFTDAIFSKFEKAIKFDATGNYTGETNLFELGEDTSTKDIKPLMKDVLFEFGDLIKKENNSGSTKGIYDDLINIVDFTDLKIVLEILKILVKIQV